MLCGRKCAGACGCLEASDFRWGGAGFDKLAGEPAVCGFFVFFFCPFLEDTCQVGADHLCKELSPG